MYFRGTIMRILLFWGQNIAIKSLHTCSKLGINNVITDNWQFTVTEWMECKLAMQMLE